MSAPWKKRLAEYRAARSRYNEASRTMSRAERTFDKLAKRIGDERAYLIAGVNFADERAVRACQDMQRALSALQDSLRGAPVAVCVKVWGAVHWLNAPTHAANDR